MMSHMLSRIIPYYNHRSGLPALFDSVMRQHPPDSEVLLVDDCSEERCDDIVEAYAHKGLPVRIVSLPFRHYTKGARLAGIEASRGKVIAFAGSDDVLWGKGALETHANLLLREGADVVHFNSVLINENRSLKKPCLWTKPFAPSLEGEAIFAAFVNQFRGPSLCCRMYSRDLCLKIIEPARTCGVKRFGEDLLLTTLLLFHAKRYRGSDLPGYGYRWNPDRPERAAGRAATMYAILTEIVPYLQKNGCPDDILKKYSDHIYALLRLNVGRLCLHAEGATDGRLALPDSVMEEFWQHVSPEIFVRLLLLGLPAHLDGIRAAKGQKVTQRAKEGRITVAAILDSHSSPKIERQGLALCI